MAQPSQETLDLLEQLQGGLHELAIAAANLAGNLAEGSVEALDGRQLSALDQAHDNASSIVASIDQVR